MFIERADPGYDWLFNHGIKGLITQFGGANSHMAIRAAETGLPAAIGVDKKSYEYLSSSNVIQLDCTHRSIKKIR